MYVDKYSFVLGRTCVHLEYPVVSSSWSSVFYFFFLLLFPFFFLHMTSSTNLGIH